MEPELSAHEIDGDLRLQWNQRHGVAWLGKLQAFKSGENATSTPLKVFWKKTVARRPKYVSVSPVLLNLPGEMPQLKIIHCYLSKKKKISLRFDAPIS